MEYQSESLSRGSGGQVFVSEVQQLKTDIKANADVGDEDFARSCFTKI